MMELSSILEDYRISYIGRGNLERTADQVVSDIGRILCVLGEQYGVHTEGNVIVGLTGAVLQQWNEDMIRKGRAVTTRNKYIVLLNPFLRWAVNGNIIVTQMLPGQEPLYRVLSPSRLPKEDAIPESERKRKYFTADEARMLLEDMPCREKVRNQAIVALFLASGFRAEELCSLSIGDFRGDDRELIYLRRKGGEWKYAEISPFCLPYIDRYLATRKDANEPSAPLFLTKNGTRCNRKQLWKVISTAEKKLGLTTGLHILRHTFNTEVASHSRPEIARDLSNHKSLAITSRYIHTSHEERQDALSKLSWSDMTPDPARR